MTSRSEALDERKISAWMEKRNPAYWNAVHYHRTFKNKRFDLAKFPYMEQPLFDDAQVILAKKATQGGWTEMLVAKGLGYAQQGLFVFWVLPTDVIKNRFVRNRFVRSIALTEEYAKHLRGQEDRVSKDRAHSMSLVHYGKGGLAFIGSNSMSGFGEFPADVGIVDEYDYCDQDNMPMVEERLSNSTHRIRILGGQPTIAGVGISKLFKDSTRYFWTMECPACKEWFRPDWFENVVRQVDDNKYEVRDPEWDGLQGPDARMICAKCERPVPRRGPRGYWEAEQPQHPVHGYHFSKLFSTEMTINEILDRFDKGLSNPSIMQRWENGDMGIEHSARGSKIQREDLEACVGGHSQGRVDASCVVGVDVGAVLHVMIGELTEGPVRVRFVGTVQGTADDLSDLRMLCAQYRIVMGVIDEKPETRMARRLAYGSRRWWMCRYTQGKRDLPDGKAKVISVDRTVQLDAVNEAVMLGKDRLILPADAMNIEGFVEQMTALTRVYDEELYGGEGGYVWAGDEADHYMHAMGYMLLAKRLVVRR